MAKIVDILNTERDRQKADQFSVNHVEASVNSYLGVLSHSSSYNVKRELFEEVDGDWILSQ